MSLRRWAKRLLIAIGAIAGLLALLLLLLQVPAVGTWVGRRLLGLAPLNPGYGLQLGSVHGNWVTGIVAEDVRLVYDGRDLARIDRLRAGYDPRELRGGTIRVRELVVDGAHVEARRAADGSWDLAKALRRSADTTSAGGAFALDRLDLRGVELVARLAPDSLVRVRDLGVRAREVSTGDVIVGVLDTLYARVAPPAVEPIWFDVSLRGAATPEVFRLAPLRVRSARSLITGALVLPRRFDDAGVVDLLDARLRASPLALADLAAFAPAVPPEGEIRLEARAEGQGGRALAHADARFVDATLVLDGSTLLVRNAGADYRLRAVLRGLDPARLYGSAPAGRLNAEVEMDLRGPELARVDGRVRVRMDDSRAAGTAVGGVRLSTEFRSGRGDVALRAVVDSGVVTARGWVRPFDSLPSYRVGGSARGLPGTSALASALGGAAPDTVDAPVLDVGFRLEGSGIVLDQAQAHGRIALTVVRRGARESLGSAAIALRDGRLELRPTLLVGGGRISGEGTISLGDTLTYIFHRGTIERVDLARLMGDTTSRDPALLSGRFTLSGRGLPPADVAADGRLELGDVGALLDRPDLAGAVTLRARGRAHRASDSAALTGSLRADVLPTTLGRLAVTGGTVNVRLSSERLTYDASLHTGAGSIALAGDARPRADVPSFAVRRGRLDSLNVGILLGRDGLRSRLDARFTAAASGTTMDRMTARLDLELQPSRLNDAALRGGRVAARIEGGDLRADARVVSPDGGLEAGVTGRVTGPRPRFATQGTLTLERLAPWTGRASPDGRLAAQWALDGVSDSAGLLVLGGTATARGIVGEMRLDSLFVALRPDSGAIALDTLLLRADSTALDGGGRLALREGAGTSLLRVAGRIADIGPLAALAGYDSVSLDSATLALTVAGPANRRNLSVDADAHRLFAAGATAERVRLRAEATTAGLRPEALSGDVRLTGGSLGRFVVRQAAVSGRYDSVFALQGEATLRDSMLVRTTLNGAVTGDSVRGRLDRLELIAAGRRWSLERPVPFVARPRIEVDSLVLSAGDRRVTLDGVLDFHGTSDLRLGVQSVDLGILSELELAGGVGGRLDATLQLAGPARAPTLAGRLDWSATRLDGDSLGRLHAELDWNERGLRIDARGSQRGGAGITAVAMLPWRLTLAPTDTGRTVGIVRSPEDTVLITVRSDSLDLALVEPLLPPGTTEGLGGTLAVDARVSGRLSQPQSEGTARLSGFHATLPALGVTYQSGEFAARLEAGRLRLERLVLTTDEGGLTASGEIGLRPLDDPSLDITADLRNFMVSQNDMLRASATGQVRLGGKLSTPSLTGSVALGRTDIILATGTAAAADVDTVTLSETDLRTVARDFGTAVLADTAESPSLLDRFRLDLAVRFPGQVWFRKRSSPKIDIELAGNVRVRQEPGEEMQYFGSVTPVPGRGAIDIYEREFRLEEGRITLNGPVAAAAFDVTARYELPGQSGPDEEPIVIDVEARGRLDSLALDFESEPTMSEDDIVSYILTGQPASDNALVGQSVGQTGANIAIGALSESIAGAAGERLGLDVLQIRTDGLRGLTLTAGRYVSPRLFVSLQQPIQLSEKERRESDASQSPGFELEYTVRRWLRANMRTGDVPFSLFFRGRYAY